MKIMCDWCEKEFERKRIKPKNKHNFCSNACKGKYQSIEHKERAKANRHKYIATYTCSYCGKDVEDYIRCAKNKKHHFCDSKCQSKMSYERTEETKEKMRNSNYHKNLKGENNPAYVDGRTLKQYFCKKCSEQIDWSTAINGSYLCGSCSAKERLKNPANHPMFTNGWTLMKSHCVDCSNEISYRAERCLRCETIRRIKNKIWSKPKNKPETLLETILMQLFPNEYKFVGDGSFVVDCFNPDFINVNGQKKIIEMFGDYWHNIPKVKKRDELRLEAYKKYGYKTLIIWEKELINNTELCKKILNFHNIK